MVAVVVVLVVVVGGGGAGVGGKIQFSSGVLPNRFKDDISVIPKLCAGILPRVERGA